MKALTAILLAGTAGCAAWGQTSKYCAVFDQDSGKCVSWAENHGEPHNGPVVVGGVRLDGFEAQPKPLKCGKYQHPVMQCAPTLLNPPEANCHPTGDCADDMHSVTEKEWQEILRRLKFLEDKPVWHGFSKDQK